MMADLARYADGPFAPLSRSVVPYRFWSRIHNLGDGITPLILKEAFGLDGISGSKTAPHLLSIGSIFALATPSSIIWGSGVMNPDQPITNVALANIRAVRGKLTAATLHKNGLAADVPLGDPGIFASMLSGGREREPPAYRLAIIPHHSGFDSPIYDRLRNDREICLVDLRDQTLLPLNQIAASEAVVSESLHGLIFAEALGKPSRWYSTKSSDLWNFKFMDWLSTTQSPDTLPVTTLPSTASGWIELSRSACLHGDMIDQTALLAAFPWELVFEHSRPLIDVAQCRKRCPVTVRVPGAAASIDRHASIEWPDFRQRLGPIGKNAMKMTQLAFDGFAEWQYHLVSFDAAPVWRPAALNEVIRLLNKFAGLDCIALHPRSSLETSPPVKIENHLGTVFSKSFLPSSNIMFRPNKNLNTAGVAASVFL